MIGSTPTEDAAMRRFAAVARQRWITDEKGVQARAGVEPII